MDPNVRDEMMEDGAVEIFTKACEENQPRKILAIIKECGNLDEAKAKVASLLSA